MLVFLSFWTLSKQQVSDPDEFYFSYEFFNSCDIEFVPVDSISLVDFLSPSEVDIIDYKPSSLGSIESSSVDSSLTLPFIEDSKVTCVSTKVTRIGSFLLNMILMLLFLGDGILSWIHNFLLVSPCCSSCNCICICPARAYEPDAGFHAVSSLYKPSSFVDCMGRPGFTLINQQHPKLTGPFGDRPRSDLKSHPK